VTLTGVPLILLATAATVATGAATARLWPRGGRLRPLTRTLGVLLLEALAVTTVGLVVNRQQQFYPSWAALAGHTGTSTVTRATEAGRFDARLPDGRATAVLWRPADLRAWRLAGPPRLVVPAGYRERPGDTFPVVLDLVPAVRAVPAAVAAALRATGAVTVVAVPTAATTAAALRTLPGELRRDVRVSDAGWYVAGTGAQAPLAAAFVRAAPAGLAASDRGTNQLPPALAAPMRLPS
jgi:lysyl-tRNA synthetase class 2